MIEIKHLNGTRVIKMEIPEGSSVHRELMGEHYVNFKFSTGKPIYFRLGDYCFLPGFGRFELTKPYFPKYNSSTGGYDYNLKLDAHYIKWRNKVVKYNPQNAASETSFHLTAAIAVHLNVITSTINAIGNTDPNFRYDGNEITFSLKGMSENDVKAAKYKQYDNTDIISALDNLASIYDCDWWVEDSVICFGRCELGEIIDFEIDRNVSEMGTEESKNEYANRIIAFGSTRNLPRNYRPDNSVDIVRNGIVQKRLMLPVADCPNGYVQDAGVDSETAAVEAIFIDENIYPRVTCRVSQVETYESTATDETTGETVTETYYRLKDGSGFQFSNALRLDGEELHILFQSGRMNGMDFVCIYNDEKKYYEVVMNEDHDRPLPDTNLHPEVEDEFVLYGWDSTKLTETGIIEAAEAELLAAARKKLERMKVDPNTHPCKMNSVWYEDAMLAGGEEYVHYSLGQRVCLINPACYSVPRNSRIIGYDIKLDLPFDAPTYIVGEAGVYSRGDSLQAQIDSLTFNGGTYEGGIGGSGIFILTSSSKMPSTDTNVHSAKRSDLRFLRKDVPDTAKELITFKQGLVANNMVSREFLESLGGFGGFGFRMNIDENKMSHMQVDFLDVVKKAVFAALEVRKYTAIGGNLVISGADSTIVEVEPIAIAGRVVAYKCYIKTDDGTQRTQNTWQVGMQALCQSFNIAEGVYQDVSNQYFWRVVTEVGQREPIMTYDPDTGNEVQAVDEEGNPMWREAYVVLSNDPAYCDKGSSAPKADDVIVHCGFNKIYYACEIDPDDNDLRDFPVELTGVLILDSNAVSGGALKIATSIRMLDLVTSFSLADAHVTAKIARDGTEFNSATFKWSTSIGKIAPVVYVGAYDNWDWGAGNIPFYHEVDYADYRWLCINPDGAPQGELPYEGSRYWKVQKSKGVTFNAYLEHASDNITVDADGNVVDGLWEETEHGGIVSKVYKLHSAIFAQKNEDFLTLDYVEYGLWENIDFSKIAGLPYHSLVTASNGFRYRWTGVAEATAADVPGMSRFWERYDKTDAIGHYHVEISPSDCHAVVKEGMLQIMAITNVKDGVNNSADDNWSDSQWDDMRAMRRCSVSVTVVMEGRIINYLDYVVNIDHIPTTTITSDIDNQSGSLSWSETKNAYINALGGIIRSTYKNKPISPYFENDNSSTPEFDESMYNPYIEFVKEDGSDASNLFNGSVSPIDVTDNGASYKALKLQVAPKAADANNIADGRYTVKVHFVVKVAGVYYEKTVTHDIIKDSKGVTFELRPSVSQIRATYDNNGALVPSVNSIFCAVDMYDSEGKRETTSDDWTTFGLSMKVNGNNLAIGETIGVSAKVRDYLFVLYENGTATNERENVPVIADGHDGEDGGDVEYIYTRVRNKDAANKPATPSFNGVAATSRIEESATDTNGVMWTNHPQGTTTEYACEYMSCRYSYADPDTGERKWKNDWRSPVEWHRDGDGLEYIYLYTKKSSSPTTPLANNATTDKFVPSTTPAEGESGWLDEANSSRPGWTAIDGCNKTWRYLWQSLRKKDAGGNWSNFSDPILRDHYAYDGLSLSFDKKNVGIPCDYHGKPKSGETITVTATLKCGKDDPDKIVAPEEWTVTGLQAAYTYSPDTTAEMRSTTVPLTITATYPDGSTQTITEDVVFYPVVDGRDGEDSENTEYIYTRTANKDINPGTPSFIGTAATSQITESATDENGVVWTNHPQGVTSALACEWMSMRVSSNNADGKRKWSNNFCAPIEWLKDGDGLEQIFCYTKTDQQPQTTITNNAETDDFVPSTTAAEGESGWLDNEDSEWIHSATPTKKLAGCDSEYRYLWQRTRKKDTGGNWGDFSAPVLRDHYAYDGLSLIIDKQNVGVPCNSDGKPKDNTPIVVTARLAYGKDAPSGIVVNSGWTADGLQATYTYTPNKNIVMSQTTKTLTVTATYPDGSSKKLEATVQFYPVVNGVGINNIKNYYALGTSPTQAPAKADFKCPKDNSTAPTNATEEYPYLWNYEMVYGDNGNLIVDGSAYPHVVDIYGKSIKDMTDYYIVCAEDVTPTRSTDGWTNDSDSLVFTDTMRFVWNYEEIKYTDGSKGYVEPHLIGMSGNSIKTTYEKQYRASSVERSNHTDSDWINSGWKNAAALTDWSESVKYCYVRERAITYTNGELTDTGDWAYNLHGVWGKEGAPGLNSHKVSFETSSPLALTTDSKGNVSGFKDSNNLAITITPVVENGNVTRIAIVSAVHCKVTIPARTPKYFYFSAFDAEKYYNEDGVEVNTDTDTYEYSVPYSTGYVRLKVFYTDRTTNEELSEYADFVWNINFAVFMGYVLSDNKQWKSHYKSWRTVGDTVYNNVSEVIQTAENWMVGVTGLDLSEGKTIATYLNLKADSATLENYATKTDAQGFAGSAANAAVSSLSQTYAGIGLGNGRIIGVASNFAIYKPVSGKTVADFLNDSNGTYDGDRALYWDALDDKWCFSGKIFSEAGDIGCLHIDGDGSTIVVRDSEGDNFITLSTGEMPMYDAAFENVQLRFGSSSTSSYTNRTFSCSFNASDSAGLVGPGGFVQATEKVTRTSDRLYAPDSNPNVLSKNGAKIKVSTTISNVSDGSYAISVYLVGYKSGREVSRYMMGYPNPSLSDRETRLGYMTIDGDSSVSYYIEVCAQGYRITASVSVTVTISYTQNKVINFIGRDGVLFGRSASRYFQVKDGNAYVNGFPVVNLLCSYKVDGVDKGQAVTKSSTFYNNNVQDVTITSNSVSGRYDVSITFKKNVVQPIVLVQGRGSQAAKCTLNWITRSTNGVNFAVDVSDDATLNGGSTFPWEFHVLDVSVST